MSLHEYLESQQIELRDYPFYALIMAAMRQADSTNAEILKAAYPQVQEELLARYWAPGGELPSD